MGFLGFETAAEKKAKQNAAMRKQADENAKRQYAEDETMMNGTKLAAAPAATAVSPARTTSTATAAPPPTVQNAARALSGRKAQIDWAVNGAVSAEPKTTPKMKDGGVIDKTLLKRKAEVMKKRGC